MNITWSGARIPRVLVAGCLLWSGVLVGCGKDEGTAGVTSGAPKITVEQILFNPKSPAPGDTLRATAIVTADGNSLGDFVTYDWSVIGGAGYFLESDRASVRWVAPKLSDIFTFTVVARNSGSSSELSDNVFVGRLVEFIPERAGQLFNLEADSALYYLRGPRAAADGLVVRFKRGAIDEDVFADGMLGTQYSFDRSRSHEAHTTLVSSPRRLTVVHGDIDARTHTTIARDDRYYPPRPFEFTEPSVSPNGQIICYQAGLLDQVQLPSQGGVDTFAVYVYAVAGGTTQRVTFRGHSTQPAVSDCFYPSVSSDDKYVVFVSDRGSPTVWELYALPINGTTVTPDTIPDAIVRLTDTGGQMAVASSMPPGRVTRQWNPNPASPILAVIGADSKLRLVPTPDGGIGARAVDIEGRVTDIAWGSSGVHLWVVATDPDGSRTRIYRVAAADGAVEEVVAGAEGDRLTRVSASPDGEFVVYAIQRGSDVWYELFDLGGTSGGTETIRITPAYSQGEAVTYGPPLQSFRPAWRLHPPGGRTVRLFFLDEATPRVMSLDLSGIGGR